MIEVPGYRELEQIGAGGTAVVFSARPLGSHGRVAVKVIRFAEDGERRRFDREINLMRALVDVSNVVPIYDNGVTATGECFLVMPLLGGGSVHQLLARSGPIHWFRAAHYAHTLTRAVAHAHERRILHLDIKPGNVLLDDSGIPHLADFGIAELMGRTASLSGAMITPAFTPPERLVDAKPSPMTDIYGIGALLFTMLTGRPPFGSGLNAAPGSVLLSVLQDPAPVEELPYDVPDRLRSLVSATLSKDPADRPATARALQYQLGCILERPTRRVEEPTSAPFLGDGRTESSATDRNRPEPQKLSSIDRGRVDGLTMSIGLGVLVFAAAVLVGALVSLAWLA